MFRLQCGFLSKINGATFEYIMFYILCQFFLSRNILGNTKYAILKRRVVAESVALHHYVYYLQGCQEKYMRVTITVPMSQDKDI